ncbi:hypothetical protein PMIN01_11464 [Paraphaeosphaeria minitans]|uniref:Uncharacterized protein n=1 Tax=Paraphaeosphaeria minitans TaxID=565426 RepID=A0A9P6GA19_9PLEO|nr:hypothetical protein PMIN01_11464 [Paraphaeosphaeria minitans]
MLFETLPGSKAITKVPSGLALLSGLRLPSLREPITLALLRPSIGEITTISQRRRREAAVFLFYLLLPTAGAAAGAATSALRPATCDLRPATCVRACARFSASLKPATLRIGVQRQPVPASTALSRNASLASLATLLCLPAQRWDA